MIEGSLTSDYYSTIGNSTLATTNRIYKLATGKLPKDIDYTKTQNGTYYVSPNANTAKQNLVDLYSQAEDIQFVVSSMTSAQIGLEEISTRLDVIDGLVDVVEERGDDLSYTARYKINNQINYTLYEIDEIAQTRGFAKVPVLNGFLEEERVELYLFSGTKIDATNAFKSVTTEALELPKPGEAYVKEENTEDLKVLLDNAKNKIQEQMNEIEKKGIILTAAFSEISSALMESDSSLMSSGTNDTIYDTLKYSAKSGNDLILSMNYMQKNYLTDNSYYQKINDLIS